MPGNCQYKKAWEDPFPWISPVQSDKRSASCSICLKTFRIDNSGIGQVKSHARSHESGTKKNVAANWKNQRTFMHGEKGMAAMSTPKKLNLTDKDKIKKAELIQALHIVDKNISFSSAKNDNARFKLMFPDSAIAQGYEQSDTKVQYVIKYALADHVKQGLIEDSNKIPYTFLFDETTTSQVKKQYDGYIIYWSNKTGLIEHAYCGSLFVGHCKADDLVDHYKEFVRQYGLDSKYLLHIGMDGPNVNFSFENKLTKLLLEEHNTSFLKLGSCSLHPVHGAFEKGVKQFYDGTLPHTEKEKQQLLKDKDLVIKPKTFDIDDLFIDIHFFFKLSSARREDYASLVELTGVVAEYAQKHAETRWVSMKKVAVRCLQQWPNLEEYFLRYLPKQSNFKRDIMNTQRYARLKEAFSDPLMPAYVSFVIFVASDFDSFLVPFQSAEPLIHHLYPAMTNLLYELMRKFIKSSKLDANDLSNNVTINVKREKNLKSLKLIEVGCKAKTFFSQNDLITDEGEEKFRKRCLMFFQTAVGQLQLNLPFDVNLVKDAQYINPLRRKDAGATSAISNIALKITKVLENVLDDVFEMKNVTKDQLVDKIRSQWHFFQNEELKEEWYTKEATSTSGRKQDSYWAEANVECGIDANTPLPSWSRYKRIDLFWGKVGHLVDEFGAKKYAQLVALVKCVLSLSHGNSTPERGFSINKILLGVHGTRTYEDTIVALRMVKHTINRVGGVLNFPITRGLLDKTYDAWMKYDADREARHALEVAEQKQKRKQEDEVRQKSEMDKQVMEIDDQIEACKSNVSVANDLIERAHETITKAVNTKNAAEAKKLTQQGSSELQVGIERKRKFEGSLQELMVKKNKLLKK